MRRWTLDPRATAAVAHPSLALAAVARVEWRSGPSRNPLRAESLAMPWARLCCCASAGRIGVESARERARFYLLQCARPLLTGGRGNVCACVMPQCARWVLANASFDLDRNVSVFETNIRVLGA